MFDIFYTLFKYKEKNQKDELGLYPEKVNVRAFPERRYLWTSRFLVIMSCLSLCFSMVLGGALSILIPLRTVKVMPLQIDFERYQVTVMNPAVSRAYAGDLVTESLMAKYIIQRYTIKDDFEELTNRFGEHDFLFLASDTPVYRDFDATERPYFESLWKKGVRREVKINMIYPVSMDFWQVRFSTIDTIPERSTPLISYWIATLRMSFNFSKYDDKDLGIINPFGMTINSYSVSYMGNNVKSERH